jgi:hypothetical protein
VCGVLRATASGPLLRAAAAEMASKKVKKTPQLETSKMLKNVVKLSN